jgi:hypothetical protein
VGCECQDALGTTAVDATGRRGTMHGLRITCGFVSLFLHGDTGERASVGTFCTKAKTYIHMYASKRLLVRVLVREISCGRNSAMLLSDKFANSQWSTRSWRRRCREGEKIRSLVEIPLIVCCDHARQQLNKQKPTFKLTFGILQIRRFISRLRLGWK